jgi:hypothetical protein
MLPDLFDVSSWGVLSSFISFTPNLVVPRGNAERLLSSMPQPIVEQFPRTRVYTENAARPSERMILLIESAKKMK